MEGAEEGIERVVDSKDMQQQTKAFDKLTDRVEDRQLDSSRVQEVLFTLSLLSFLVIAFEIENTFRSAFISFSKSRPKTEIKQPNVAIKFHTSDSIRVKLNFAVLSNDIAGHGINCCIC